VLAISCDPIAAKQAWGKALGGISFPLVSDFWPHGQVASAYGVFNPELGRSDRSIFIVDKQGILRWIKRYEPGVMPEIEPILAELRKLS
jgi:alkyl hydroperoxide reductase subunit AhpC